MGCGARVGPAETVMVRQYGFPSCQGSAPSSAPASTGFVPPAANRQVGLLKAVAAKPPMSNSPSSGETQPYMLMCLNSPGGGPQCDAAIRCAQLMLYSEDTGKHARQFW